MTNDLFKTVVVGIIFDPAKKEILIGKSNDGYWSFLETDLTYEIELDKALKKSAKEKTGYVIKNLGAVFAENCAKPKDKLALYFLCEVAEGKEKLGKGIKELKWIKPSKVSEYLDSRLPTRLKEYITNLG